MTDREKKNQIADILLDFYDEYNSNVINRPMIPNIYAGKILDSLQEEPVSEDLEEEIKDFFEERETWDSESQPSKEDIARHFANWQKQQDKQPINEDLSAEIDNLSKRYPEVSFDKLARIAVLVAKWQRQKDRKWLADNHKQIFNNGWSEGYEVGRDSMEEDMMKDAIETTIKAGTDSLGILVKGLALNKYNFGDKVKVIIIKQDEE